MKVHVDNDIILLNWKFTFSAFYTRTSFVRTLWSNRQFLASARHSKKIVNNYPASIYCKELSRRKLRSHESRVVFFIYFFFPLLPLIYTVFHTPNNKHKIAQDSSMRKIPCTYFYEKKRRKSLRMRTSWPS